MLEEETVDESKPLTLFHPVDTWKKMTVTDFHTKELLQPIFVDGELVYQQPKLQQICAFAREEMESFWEEYRRLRNPHVYKVDLSQKLYDLKQELLKKARNGKA